MTIAPDQKILISGFKRNSQNNFDFTLAAFTVDGLPDLSFGTNGSVIKSFAKVDNYFFAPLAISESFFVGGYGVDEYGLSSGMIAKFKLVLSPLIMCPGNIVVTNDSGSCSAEVFNIDPRVLTSGAVLRYSRSGATSGSGTGSVSGKTFNKGITTVTYSSNNDLTQSCSFNVTVEDKETSVISGYTADPVTLWPADHRMKDVNLKYSLNDNCGIGSVTINVDSNEPVQTSEQGDLFPDWQIIDNSHVRLRAERLESGNGRVYTIKLTVKDLAGNESIKTVNVNVPKTKAQNSLLLTAAPNPSRNYFSITGTSNSDSPISLSLIDNTGNRQLVATNLVSPVNIKVGENLSPGIYYLEAIQENISQTIKLVKQ